MSLRYAIDVTEAEYKVLKPQHQAPAATETTGRLIQKLLDDPCVSRLVHGALRSHHPSASWSVIRTRQTVLREWRS
jgi:predicted phosphohydrolase